ncbi:sporulation histidine kinase inhibitor Sda [Alkalihalophilus lindianensis]|uniref:Sporulation histidine kinase inhibitor Sda n=1 Tax=Alkalihalophilus lindianensis TaxID=1630542 RepID=A0ABU3XE60_9BACI|nr:sporulation histidine kinase inhibitor Sda [Alkalihalophilus lindianensis]MDV2685892.1 sporulation histidine kinase inhibitor Sda [Alkalihalophilus lindianensis]
MEILNDEVLIQSYHKALELKLHEDFIQLLFQEICKRNLHSLSNDLPSMEKTTD